MKKNILLSFVSLFLFFQAHAQIEVSTSLEDAITKAIEKSSSLKNKNLEVEKLNLQKKSVWNKYILPHQLRRHPSPQAQRDLPHHGHLQGSP